MVQVQSYLNACGYPSFQIPAYNNSLRNKLLGLAATDAANSAKCTAAKCKSTVTLILRYHPVFRHIPFRKIWNDTKNISDNPLQIRTAWRVDQATASRLYGQNWPFGRVRWLLGLGWWVFLWARSGPLKQISRVIFCIFMCRMLHWLQPAARNRSFLSEECTMAL